GCRRAVLDEPLGGEDRARPRAEELPREAEHPFAGREAAPVRAARGERDEVGAQRARGELGSREEGGVLAGAGGGEAAAARRTLPLVRAPMGGEEDESGPLEGAPRPERPEVRVGTEAEGPLLLGDEPGDGRRLGAAVGEGKEIPGFRRVDGGGPR